MRFYLVLAGSALVLALASPALCQPTASTEPPVATPAPPNSVAPTPPTPTTECIPEGTELSVQFEDSMSSATAAEGDVFSFTTINEIRLADGAVIPAGYRGRGEITNVERRGMLGKPGQLNLRLDYLRIGPTRVPVRANYGRHGADGAGKAVFWTVMLGPLGLLAHGDDTRFTRGQIVAAQVDEDTDIPWPAPPPPTPN
jgi:hypothetical protein